MPTIRQRKLAKELVRVMESDETPTMKTILEDVGYSRELADSRPSAVIEALGTQEALKEYGFDTESAKHVVSTILHKEEAKDKDRLTAAGMVFDVTGAYAPVKSVVAQVPIRDSTPEVDELRAEFEEKLRLKLGE